MFYDNPGQLSVLRRWSAGLRLHFKGCGRSRGFPGCEPAWSTRDTRGASRGKGQHFLFFDAIVLCFFGCICCCEFWTAHGELMRIGSYFDANCRVTRGLIHWIHVSFPFSSEHLGLFVAIEQLNWCSITVIGYESSCWRSTLYSISRPKRERPWSNTIVASPIKTTKLERFRGPPILLIHQ